MKNYTKLFMAALFAMILTIATSTFAADTVAAGSVASTTPSVSLYNAGEIGVQASTGYAIDRANLFKTPYSLNATVGTFVFPTRLLGAEFNLPLYQSKGISVDEVQAGLLLRAPLSSTTPVLRNLAPYVGFGGAYNWQNSAANLSYIAKAGLEVRLARGWGIFGEGQYRNNTFSHLATSADTGALSLQGGLRLSFR